MNNIWISIELEENLGGDLWIQNLTLSRDAVTVTSQEIHDQSSQILLAGYNLVESSLAKLSLAELSIVELSLAELTEYN